MTLDLTPPAAVTRRRVEVSGGDSSLHMCYKEQKKAKKVGPLFVVFGLRRTRGLAIPCSTLPMTTGFPNGNEEALAILPKELFDQVGGCSQRSEERGEYVARVELKTLEQGAKQGPSKKARSKKQ